MRSGAAVLALLGAAAASPIGAQAPALTVIQQNGVARVQTTALLADGKYVTLLRSGFPLRLHYRLELWRSRSGWFDQSIADLSWDALARHDPLADDFVLLRSTGRGRAARYGSAEDLARALEIPYRAPLKPEGAGSFYYLCRLDVTTLNDADLEELQRYLKGDVGPAIPSGGDVGDVLTRGARRLLVRIAGLPRLTLEARSEPLTLGGTKAGN